MPMHGWKPDYHIPPRPKKVWGPPPDISPHKHLKRGQLTKNKIPLQRRDPTEDELRILHEREIYRQFNLHASKEELQKQYKQFANEKVYPGMIRAWLMNSYQGEADRVGMPDGQGSADLRRGISYEGMFRQGLLHGQGHLKWGKGNSYEGNFSCNRLLGKGVYTWAGGAAYSGEIYDGIPHGIGTMERKGGLKYEGCWEHGKRHGKGKMTFGNIAVYEGNWKNDLQDGEGHLVFTTGSSYHGNWLEGKRHGQGYTQVQRIVPSREKKCQVSAYSHTLALKGKPDSIHAHTYSGDWLRGLPHGRGKSEWSWDNIEKDSSFLINSYVGSYENGMRHGEGSFFYASGALFQGNWRKNMKVGLGILVYETGKLHFGVFSHDHYDPISNPGLDIKEPLESALQLASEDIQTSKYRVWRAIMRHKNIIQNVFTLYCSIAKETPELIVTPPPEEDKKVEETKKAKQKDKSAAKDTKVGQSKSPPKNKAAKQESKEESPKKKNIDAGKKDPKEKDGKDEINKSKDKEPPKEEIHVNGTKDVAQIVQLERPKSLRSIRGMSNEQFWRLLHDGHMLCPGLGYGEVDRMLPSNDLAWDPFSDVHSYNRQLILREIVSGFIQVGLTRYQHENISSEEKIEKFLASHLQLLKFVDNDSLFAKVEVVHVQNVLHDNRTALDRLFCELILESETPDYTIKLKSLVHFGQNRRPEVDVPNGSLLASVALEVYGTHIVPEDSSKLLDQDINYKEYEVILLLFATMGNDLPKVPDDDISSTNLTNKPNTTSPDGNKSPKTQDKAKGKSSPTKDLKGKDGKNSPKSPTSPKSPKVVKDGQSKPKGNETNDRNLPKVTKVDVRDAKEKSEEARLKAKEEYNTAIANLLNNFIVGEVAVYKPPKVVKGVDSKNMKGKPQNPGAKVVKK